MNTYYNYILKNYYALLLCIVVFLLPYSIAFTNVFIILLSIFWLKDILTGRLIQSLKANYLCFLPFLLLFSAYLLSVLYSSDIKVALANIEKRVSIFLLPMIICSIPFSRKNIESIFYSFILSIVLCCFVALTLTTSYFVNNPQEYYLEKALWYLPQAINFHAPYLALYLVISNTLCYYFYFQKNKTGVVPVAFFINNIFLFLISSRTALVINWVFIIGLSSYHLYKSKGKIITILNLFIIGGILGLAYVNVPYLHTKISKLTEAAYGVNQRVVSADAALKVIKNNLFLGVGIGDVQTELDGNLPDNTYKGYNVHNQYLHELMIYGLLGFVFFISIFLVGYYRAVSYKNLSFILFLSTFLVLFLTEVILARYKGIILFSIFYPLFLNLSVIKSSTEMNES